MRGYYYMKLIALLFAMAFTVYEAPLTWKYRLILAACEGIYAIKVLFDILETHKWED